MATLTTANLFSHQTFRDLILEPMIADSVVLPALRRIETDSSIVYLPRVSGGNVAWTAEAAEIADSNIAANMLEVIPRKLAGLVLTSNESIEDANAATILGTALARQLAAAVDASFFAAGGAPAPVGLPGVAGIPEVTAGGAGLDDYASAIGELEAAGGRPTVIFVSPGRWTALMQTKDANGSMRPLLASQSVGPTGQVERAIFGVPVRVVSGLADTRRLRRRRHEGRERHPAGRDGRGGQEREIHLGRDHDPGDAPSRVGGPVPDLGRADRTGRIAPASTSPRPRFSRSGRGAKVARHVSFRAVDLPAPGTTPSASGEEAGGVVRSRPVSPNG